MSLPNLCRPASYTHTDASLDGTRAARHPDRRGDLDCREPARQPADRPALYSRSRPVTRSLRRGNSGRRPSRPRGPMPPNGQSHGSPSSPPNPAPEPLNRLRNPNPAPESEPAPSSPSFEPGAPDTAGRLRWLGWRGPHPWRRRLSSGARPGQLARPGLGTPSGRPRVGCHMEDGHVRHPLETMRQAEAEPARNPTRKGGDDHLVELTEAECITHGSHGVWVADDGGIQVEPGFPDPTGADLGAGQSFRPSRLHVGSPGQAAGNGRNEEGEAGRRSSGPTAQGGDELGRAAVRFATTRILALGAMAPPFRVPGDRRCAPLLTEAEAPRESSLNSACLVVGLPARERAGTACAGPRSAAVRLASAARPAG